MVLRLIVLALATILPLGCFVLDELDNSKKLLDKPSFSSQEEKKPEVPAQPQAAPEKGHADLPSVGDWWKKTRSLVPGEVGSEVVKCGLDGAVQFMRRPDCLARGGTPHPAGG